MPQIYTLFLLNSFMHLMGKNLVQDWYCFAKTKAEKAAWDFAETHNLNLKVTICPSVTMGSMLQASLNQSSTHILKYLNGNPPLCSCKMILHYGHSRFEHICNTIFLEDFLLLQFTQDALYFSLTANITQILPPTL